MDEDQVEQLVAAHRVRDYMGVGSVPADSPWPVDQVDEFFVGFESFSGEGEAVGRLPGGFGFGCFWGADLGLERRLDAVGCDDEITLNAGSVREDHRVGFGSEVGIDYPSFESDFNLV